MFDITPYIKLNSKERGLYNLIKLLLIGFFVIICILFTKEIIFPTQTFQFKSSINSLANTISIPYETPFGTGFHISTDGDFNQAQLTITLPKIAPKLPKNTQLLIKKSYLAFLSPINTKKYTDHIVTTFETDDALYIQKSDGLHKFISENAFDSYLFKDNTIIPSADAEQFTDISDEPEGFAPATLISSKDSVYVTDADKKHPFQDERAFLTLGYNFDNVINTNSEERSLHKKAKSFTVSSSHPSGTLFYTTDTDKIFIFDNNLLNKIPLTATAKKHSVSVEEKSRMTVATCTLKKTLFSRQYKCNTSLDNITSFIGNTYQFTLKDAPNTTIEKSKIKLYTTPNKKSFYNRINAIKRKINTIYN